MAFNFNWSPLIADTSRAREMLTSALNKSPKPPIIVDDIIVTELNLGSVPPQLDILEIGDLAVDRFRGIFKMQYSGDAFMTLKTRVQANPLNTYLSTKPSFASPQPLAASAPLTIPLQITLSEIKLSGFVILVFSKQKGITLVFRNDPLESLKVSSTFDSVTFIRDYLQKQIEKQLRQLFMEDLPVIIHRLSLRVWPGPDSHINVNSNTNRLDSSPENPTNEQLPIDPLATPSMRAGGTADNLDVDGLSLEGPGGDPTYPSFSQKNLLRLAALTDSHRTLSLFTPPIQDVVFRAWAGAAERGINPTNRSQLGHHATPPLTLASLGSVSRLGHGSSSSVSSLARSEAGGPAASVASAPLPGQAASQRPALSAFQSMHGSTSYTPSILGSRSRPHGARKRKNRVVNLRKNKDPEEIKPQEDAQPEVTHANTAPGSAESSADYTEDSQSERPSTPTSSTGPTSYSAAGDFYNPQVRDGEIDTAPNSPEKRLEAVMQQQERTPRPRGPVQAAQSVAAAIDSPSSTVDSLDLSKTPRLPRRDTATEHPAFTYKSRQHAQSHQNLRQQILRSSSKRDEAQAPSVPFIIPGDMKSPDGPSSGSPPGGILEQAWMMKMATEIARKVAIEHGNEDGRSFWDGVGFDDAPPAYEG